MKRSYLGSLALLYLFTLLGGIPVIISAFRDPGGHAAAPEAAPAQEEAKSTFQAEFYSLQKNWMRPLRLSAGIPVMTMMAAVIGGRLAAAEPGRPGAAGQNRAHIRRNARALGCRDNAGGPPGGAGDRLELEGLL